MLHKELSDRQNVNEPDLDVIVEEMTRSESRVHRWQTSERASLVTGLGLIWSGAIGLGIEQTKLGAILVIAGSAVQGFGVYSLKMRHDAEDRTKAAQRTFKSAIEAPETFQPQGRRLRLVVDNT